jgi:hypothetical protein
LWLREHPKWRQYEQDFRDALERAATRVDEKALAEMCVPAGAGDFYGQEYQI